ncbi:MAG: hypothetical protein ACOYM3_11700 [Terrimicrobiaceae bacterium]
MRRICLSATQNELLRHIRLGKSIRSTEGANQVRNFILAAQARPSIKRLCLAYHLSFTEVCTVCTEILAEAPAPDPSEENGAPAATAVFCDPLQLEGLLKKIHYATHGQTDIQRRLAIVACAKSHAAQIAAPVSRSPLHHTRSNLLKLSIRSKLPVVMICAGIIILGVLIAAYLL